MNGIAVGTYERRFNNIASFKPYTLTYYWKLYICNK